MSDPLDTKTKQVADAYWGTAPSPARRDAHGLGDPPRVMTDSMRRYLDIAASTMFGFWIACSVLFTLTHVVTIVASGNLWFPPVLPILFIGLAVASGRKGCDSRFAKTGH